MPDPGADDPGLRAARRTATLAIAAFAALVVALVAGVLIDRATDDGGDPSTIETASGALLAQGIGPPDGATIADHVAARQAALAAVPAREERSAVVSFTRWRTAGEADEVLGLAGVTGSVTVEARLVAAPGGRPAVVTGDLDAWARDTAAAAESDRAEVERLLPTVDKGSEFVAFYQHELVRLAAVRDGARADGAVVSGLLVKGSGDALRALASRPEVRLVDVGGSADPPPPDLVRGLLPDDTATVGNPPMRPLPAG